MAAKNFDSSFSASFSAALDDRSSSSSSLAPTDGTGKIWADDDNFASAWRVFPRQHDVDSSSGAPRQRPATTTYYHDNKLQEPRPIYSTQLWMHK